MSVDLKRLTSSFAVMAIATGSAFGQILNLNPGPANNGGSAGWAIFFDVQALSSPLNVTHLKTANTGGAGVGFNVEVYTFAGSGLGGPVGSGPGSSSAGWTFLGTAAAVQGPVASQVSELIDIPDIAVGSGQTVGVALRFLGVGPRYFGTGTPPYSVYSDSFLQATTGDARSVPFTTTGSFFTSRAMVGELHYAVVPEPATMAALALGAGVMAFRRRRKAQ